MSIDLIIRNISIVTIQSVTIGDIAIDGGKFVEIGNVTQTDTRQTIDGSGLHAFPGLVDVHVHFNDPGRADWEGGATGSSALAAGGGTTFCDMPLNSSPAVIDGESFDRKRAALDGKSFTDFGLWGGLVPGNVEFMPALAERGVIGFKAFMSNSGIDDFGRADDDTLFRGMQQAAELGLPVAVHAEDETLTARLSSQARAAGRCSIRDYLDSRPIEAEVEAVGRAIRMAAETGCSLHIVHISSAAGARLVAAAEKAKHTVTGETCPHYLLLNADDVERIGASAKCAPPLRSASEVEALWQQVITHGGIDLIASDHSPAPASMKKSSDFFSVWGGIAGVQSTRAALLDGRLPLQEVVRLTSATPAARFALPHKGEFKINYDADVSLIDLSQSFQLQSEQLLDRHKLSPYVGRSFKGKVVRTLLRGQTIFENGRIVGPPTGRFLRSQRT